MPGFKRKLLDTANRILKPAGLTLSRRHRHDLTMDSAIERTVSRGVDINTIIDIGASNGSWTRLARRYLPQANALLIEANPYHQPALNEFGLPIKKSYETADVCKVLNIVPDTFRQRIHRGYYPEFSKINGKRQYTLQNIRALIQITRALIDKGVISAGKPE